jgi:hypothetical protein
VLTATLNLKSSPCNPVPNHAVWIRRPTFTSVSFAICRDIESNSMVLPEIVTEALIVFPLDRFTSLA